MTRVSPLESALAVWREFDPTAVALGAVGGPVINRAELSTLLSSGRNILHHSGIGAGDRLAVIMPQGLDGAIAVLQAATTCDVAPLRPDTQNLVATLRTLRPAAVITARGCPQVEAAANGAGIRLIDADRLREPATAPAAGAPASTGPLHLVVATSGSTGRPKWAALEQNRLIAGCRGTARALELSASDRLLLALPLNHTHGVVTGLMLPLLSGNGVLVCPRFDPAHVLAALSDHEITWMSLPPAMHRVLTEHHASTPVSSHKLRFLRSGSAGMPAHLVDEVSSAFSVPLIEGYGMTECPSISCNPVSAPRIGSVGPPVVEELAILDQQGNSLPPGRWGQIHVRGAPTMQGYLGPDARTESRCPQDWLATGDEGRLDDDGYLYLRGRLDDVINRGGRKVLPAEVDAALAAHPAVRDAVAFAVPHPSLGQDLAAAVVLAPGSAVTDSALNSHAAQMLPAHLVPSRIVTLTEIPVEPSGKVARRRLAERLSPILRTEYKEPQGETEQLLVELFGEVLTDRMAPGRRVGGFTNFFLDGGDSLAAMRLLARLASHGWTEISPQILFEHPTPAELAAVLGPPCRSQPTTPPETGSADDTGAYPASSAQAGLWFLQQLNPSLTAYHLPQLWRLQGDLNADALSAALTALVRRHAALRTSFQLAEGCLQQIVHPPSPVTLRVEDLSGRRQAEVIGRWQSEEASAPFDLSRGMLLRARLLRIDSSEYILLLNHHHIVSDGWSKVVLARDLAALYNAHGGGLAAGLDPVPIPYHDYVIRQQEWLSSDNGDRLRAFWKQALRDMEPLRLPVAGRRPAKPARTGESMGFTIGPAAAAGLESLCRNEGATLHMGLLAALAVTLTRQTGQQDIIVGVPGWGRQRRDLEDAIGLFVNTLPIRIRRTGSSTFRALVRQVRSTSLAAYQHQDFPFEDMAQLTSREHHRAGEPLVQAILQLVEREYEAALDLDGIVSEPIADKEFSSRFDLEFELRRLPDGGLDGQITYRIGLFEHQQIEALSRELCGVVDDAVSHPEFPAAGTEDRSRPPESWQHGPPVDVPDLCLHQLFARRVAREPEAVALMFAERTMTVAELDRASNRLAYKLIAAGAVEESIVAVCLERSPELVITLLAILKAGGAYLPLEPGWPDSRKAQALSQIACPPILVTDQPTACDWAAEAIVIDPADPALDDCPDTPPDLRGHRSRQLVYVAYTSGSTGQPKGVLIEHRSVLRLLHPTAPWALGAGDRMLHLSPVAFDAATLEIWLPLLSGATLVIAPPGPMSLTTLGEIVVKQRISALWLTAELFHAMVEAVPRALAGIRRLLAGGDVLDPNAVQSILDLMPADHMLINGYGPTESTTFATCHAMAGGTKLTTASAVPIGRALAGTTLRVVDTTGELCGIGVPGELRIGGNGLARGYLNSPELSDAKFISQIDGSDERLYRTGDLVSWRPDGTLAFHGRIDEQVKVRGYRVDPAEVAAAMSSHPAVTRAVVVPTRDPFGSTQIVAYWIRREGADATARQLRAFLTENLPEAMVPTAFVEVESFPLTGNGKLDRESLPPPHRHHSRTAGPVTETERRLHAIWSDVLGHSDFGVTDNFFLVGGHSVQTVRLHRRINEEFQSTFPLSLVIASPTVRQQAQWLSGVVESADGSTRLVTLQPDGARVPLIAVHGWGGTLYHFVDIARELAPRRPVLGLQPAGIGDPRLLSGVETMARSYADSIVDQVPEGPIHLVGHSAGGWYAYAVAAALVERGRTVGMVAILDSHAQGAKLPRSLRIRLLPLRLPRLMAGAPGRLRRLCKDGPIPGIRRRIARRIGHPEVEFDDGFDPYVSLLQRTFRPPRLPLAVDLFGPRSTMARLRATWRPYALGGLRVHPMLESHDDFLRPDHSRRIAGALESAMADVEAGLHIRQSGH